MTDLTAEQKAHIDWCANKVDSPTLGMAKFYWSDEDYGGKEWTPAMEEYRAKCQGDVDRHLHKLDMFDIYDRHNKSDHMAAFYSKNLDEYEKMLKAMGK